MLRSESKHRVRAYTNTACRAEARTHFEQIHKKGVCTHEEQTYEHQADSSRVRCHFRESKEGEFDSHGVHNEVLSGQTDLRYRWYR